MSSVSARPLGHSLAIRLQARGPPFDFEVNKEMIDRDETVINRRCLLTRVSIIFPFPSQGKAGMGLKKGAGRGFCGGGPRRNPTVRIALTAAREDNVRQSHPIRQGSPSKWCFRMAPDTLLFQYFRHITRCLSGFCRPCRERERPCTPKRSRVYTETLFRDTDSGNHRTGRI